MMDIKGNWRRYVHIYWEYQEDTQPHEQTDGVKIWYLILFCGVTFIRQSFYLFIVLKSFDFVMSMLTLSQKRAYGIYAN